MKCALASLGFINENIEYNKNVIMNTLKQCSNQVDIVLFGEAFLQGFYAATFNNEHDEKIALSVHDTIINDICFCAKQHNIAVSFGFIEKDKEYFFSSQLTIDKNGNIIDHFKRVSSGWKELFANDKYIEGHEFHDFTFMNQKIVIGLCGDLWFDENVEFINKISPNIVFWPVYTDFNYDEWNHTIKYEYASQAKKICNKVLYVNSYCLDKKETEFAKGGSSLFVNGEITKEIEAGKEGILFVEI